jgi:hypothetical protein
MAIDMKSIVKSTGLGALALLLNTSGAFAATYYLSTSGSDSNSCSAAQSSGSAKASFGSAWGCLAAGDTLIVADGTYSNAQPPTAKSGAAGAPITLRAANDGGARISTGMVFKGNAYLSFIGFKLTGSSSAVEIFSNGSGKPSHDLTFQRIGFTCTDTAQNDNACFNITDGSHHVLLEDFWGWGGGRYTVMLYGGPGGDPPNTTADYNTLRRGVLRMGPSTSSSGNPQAGLAIYYASNNVVENVIVLDSQAASNTSNAAFYLTTHAAPPQVSNNKYYGVIALNNYGIGWYLDHDGTGSNNELRNSVIWDSASAGIQTYSNQTCNNTLIDHVTIGSSGGNGFENFGCDSVSVKSSIIVNNSGVGLKKGSDGTMGTVNWNVIAGNSGGARSGVNAGSNDKTTDPALKYVARVETGSSASGAGEGGTNAGADVTKRYQDGVQTAQNLWPWAYEARIKKDMCTDAGVTRGFCSSASLTDYVWGYLGNGNPYTGTTITPPSAPTNVRIVR